MEQHVFLRTCESPGWADGWGIKGRPLGKERLNGDLEVEQKFDKTGENISGKGKGLCAGDRWWFSCET